MKFFSFNRNTVSRNLDVMMKIPQDRIIFQKMREGFRISDVIDSDEFNVVVAERGPENISADTTEAIDANLYCHLIVRPPLYSLTSCTRQPRQLRMNA